MSSPNLDSPLYDDNNEFVFFDVIGFFAIFYPASVGVILNYATAFLVFLLVAVRITHGVYSFNDLLKALLHHAIAAGFMLGELN